MLRLELKTKDVARLEIHKSDTKNEKFLKNLNVIKNALESLSLNNGKTSLFILQLVSLIKVKWKITNLIHLIFVIFKFSTKKSS